MTARTKQAQLLEVIAEMQHDIEAGQDEAAKRRRRLMLRGVRAMVNVLHYTSCSSIEEHLRDELFGVPPAPDKRLGSGK